MPRKSRGASVLEIAFSSRWPVAAGLCGISFVGGFLIIPGMLATNVLFRSIAGTIRTMSLFAVVGFGVLALVKYLVERRAGVGSSESSRRFDAARTTRARSALGYDLVPEPAIACVRSEPFVPAVPMRPHQWSLELLQSIEWKRFEEVIAAYFRAKNFRCETIEYGPDGGVDGRLYFNDVPTAVGIVQCKAWSSKQVGVAPLRELLGVMTHEKVARGYFCATGEFSRDAMAFAATNPILLITGRDLLDAIRKMPADTQQQLLTVSTTGDYTTPTCASCGIKLVQKTIGGRAMWACVHYPRCRIKIPMRKGSPATVAG